MKRILGLDPGLARTGYGCVASDGRTYQYLDAGLITTKTADSLAKRLTILYDDISQIIAQLQPEVVACEQLFFPRQKTTKQAVTNPSDHGILFKPAMPADLVSVAHARGILLLACHQANLPIHTYTPVQIKVALTNYGQADKEQVQKMVQTVLGITGLAKKPDQADALAAALTYAMESGLA